MSMGLVLKAVRDALRQSNNWTSDQCDVQPEGWPPEVSGDWYVAIDEVGVTSRSNENLHEQYRIEIFVCLRAGLFPKDRMNKAYFDDNDYLDNHMTLDPIERATLTTIQRSFGVMNYANAVGNLPATGLGDAFQGCLLYQGRGKTQGGYPPGTEAKTYWLRRILPFVGMDRMQDLQIAR